MTRTSLDAPARAGLLTFEPQGCPQFEGERQDEPEFEPPKEKAGSSIASQSALLVSDATPNPPPRKLKLDFEELLLALESSDNVLGAPIEYYLDTETGEVIPLHDDFDDAGEIRERMVEALITNFAVETAQADVVEAEQFALFEKPIREYSVTRA